MPCFVGNEIHTTQITLFILIFPSLGRYLLYIYIMNKILTIVAFFIVSNVTAQQIGFRASAGSSWFGIKEKTETNTYSDGSSAFCWSLGMTSNVKLYKSIYLQPEILFAQNSVSYTYISQRNATESNYFFYDPMKINQVQFPLNIKIKLKRLYVMTAPCYSILFGNNNKVHRQGSTYTSNRKFDKDDISIVSTIGVEVVKKPSINIEIRHYRGLTKLDDIGYHQTALSIGSSILF